MMYRLSSFLFICCISLGSGLYFHIGETEKKCFIEEIPDETMVVGNYKVEMFDKMQNQYVPTISGLGMHVEARDPDDKVIISRTYAAEGRFTFTSHAAGEHVICLHSNSTAWFGGGQLRAHFNIQVGANAIDFAQIAAKEKLSEMEVLITKLIHNADQLKREQDFQRVR